MPGRKELPATIARSPAKAQRTWIKSHDAAVKEYGEGDRAHRTAMAALKRTFEKVGDHWEPKASLAHLRDVARRLEIPGRSRMRKSELVEAIRRASR